MLPSIDIGAMNLSLLEFMPELVIILGIVGMLFLRLFRGFDRTHLGDIALFTTLIALLVSVLQWLGEPGLSAVVTAVGLSPDAGVGQTILGFKLSPPPLYSQS